ncbi:MAG: 4-hydroxythreonine-4-phosphate dehydrogenase PdxA [Duodenibacillus sp.]
MTDATFAAPVAITTGEPAGIGPEVSLKAAHSLAGKVPLALIGSRSLLKETAQRLGLPEELPAGVAVIDIPTAAAVVPGKLDVRNANYVLETLRTAAKGAMEGRFAAVATAPVQKSILTEAGHPFTGHTEFFAELSHTPKVVMMLTSSAKPDALRVALATTHLPLRAVPDAITGELLDETLAIVDRDMRTRFGLMHPKIAVTGLNPHAGESGHMGTEEIEIIAPAVERARAAGIDVSGPWPADTLFVKTHADKFDVLFCMYHDQGLPALKREGFGAGVNVTLGMPWIRTSVDHGTALDIAGQNLADAGSMAAAVELAAVMLGNSL